MQTRLLMAALVLALAATAQAQPSPQRQPLFISPAGEPFRGDDGLGAWFAGADANRDGAISRSEFRADAERFFKVADTDHDGRIDGFEIQHYERVMVPEIAAFDFGDGRRGRRSRAGGMPGGGGLQGAARWSLLNEPQPLAGADMDVDGRVTLDEWMRAAGRRFDRLDRLKAGRLTRAALPPLPGGSTGDQGVRGR